MGWASVAVLLLAAGGLWWWWAHRAANAAPTFTTQVVGRGNLTLTVTANGTIQPTRSISIGSELSGTVLKVNVDVNDRIKKGPGAGGAGHRQAARPDPAFARRGHVQHRSASGAERGHRGRKHAPAWRGWMEVARMSGGEVPSKAELDTGRAVLARAVGRPRPRPAPA